MTFLSFPPPPYEVALVDFLPTLNFVHVRWELTVADSGVNSCVPCSCDVTPTLFTPFVCRFFRSAAGFRLIQL